MAPSDRHTPRDAYKSFRCANLSKYDCGSQIWRGSPRSCFLGLFLISPHLKLNRTRTVTFGPSLLAPEGRLELLPLSNFVFLLPRPYAAAAHWARWNIFRCVPPLEAPTTHGLVTARRNNNGCRQLLTCHARPGAREYALHGNLQLRWRRSPKSNAHRLPKGFTNHPGSAGSCRRLIGEFGAARKQPSCAPELALAAKHPGAAVDHDGRAVGLNGGWLGEADLNFFPTSDKVKIRQLAN